jgi:hypothetical protein
MDIILKNINKKDLRRKINHKTGEEFYVVHVPCFKNNNGHARITVNKQDVIPVKNEKGKTITNKFNIRLGEPDKFRKISIFVGYHDNHSLKYINTRLSNTDIYEDYKKYHLDNIHCSYILTSSNKANI